MNHNQKVWLQFDYSQYNISTRKLNNWLIQAGRRKNCWNKKASQISPNLTFHQPTLQHTVTKCVQNYNLGCCVHCLINMKGPFSSLFKINFGAHVAIDFIHLWILLLGDLLTFSISFGLILNSTFLFKARFWYISFWYFLVEQDMEGNKFFDL